MAFASNIRIFSYFAQKTPMVNHFQKCNLNLKQIFHFREIRENVNPRQGAFETC